MRAASLVLALDAEGMPGCSDQCLERHAGETCEFHTGVGIGIGAAAPTAARAAMVSVNFIMLDERPGLLEDIAMR